MRTTFWAGHTTGLTEEEIEAAVIRSRLVLPDMLERKHGHIINISSMAGRTSSLAARASVEGR